MASASAGTAGDLRLRPPRFLLALLNDSLPLPDDEDRGQLGPPHRPADVAYAADAVRTHGLLAEHEADGDAGLGEEWCAAVDAWVDRLLSLMDSNREHSCWVGTCFLGLTFQECSDTRFVKYYSDWFQKVLGNMKIAKWVAQLNTCAIMHKNGESVHVLPCMIYLSVRIMSGQYNLQQLKKLASTLALLPCVRLSQNSVSLMIRKILNVVNSMLNDTFLGLKEEHSNEELLMLLVPPGTKLLPPLGGQARNIDQHILSKTKSGAYVVPAISGLIHCCSVMLTRSYPIQVANIPVRALVTLIQKVLLIDGSLHKTMFHSNASLYQEHICFDIPTLHSTFLDLLSSTIKEMHSSLISQARIVVSFIVEYFKRAKLPSIRRKLYKVVKLLMSSIGVGMVMQLLQVVISNIFADLDDNSRSSLFAACTDPVDSANWSQLKGSSDMERRHQLQNTSSSESACTQMVAPLCIKIGALETLEVLFNVIARVEATFGKQTTICGGDGLMALVLLIVAVESTMEMQDILEPANVVLL